jgi:hypothetical protein
MKTFARWFASIATLICVIFLAGCQGKARMTETATVPVKTQSPTPTLTTIPAATITIPATETVEAAVPVVRATPLVLPAGLAVEEYLLKTAPEPEGLLYFTYGDPRSIHTKERAKILPDPYCSGGVVSMCASLGSSSLVAEEIYSNDGSSGNVILKQDGVEIYRIASGPGSPVNSLRGLWVYDGHWALEAAMITETQLGNTTMVNAVGRIIVDGKVLNDSFGYEESFGFQTINGRPFYFFKRNGQIGASFDGVEIPLAYDQVPHYGCCSAAELNPRRSQNMVEFFATRETNWYYVEIGVFKQP